MVVSQVHLYVVPTKAVNNITYSLAADSTESYLLDRTTDLHKEGDQAIERWIVINPPADFNGKQIQGTTSRLLTDSEAGAILDSSILFTYKKPVTDNQQWEANQRVSVGDVRLYNSIKYECIQSHTTLANWQPSIVPALWKIYVEPGSCPNWVQPTGAHDAYNIGDCVTFNGSEYESLINANVWSPSVYPAGWRKK